ncbi:MAG: hypothetical protein M3N43_06260 [Actinomycetota bacterium]|nr:hypothetical protein [Actinomycetota bacterium]
MFTFKQAVRVAQGALLFSALLTFGAASTLSAQQPEVQAAAVAASAPVATSAPAVAATPAPAPSALFVQDEARPVTLAAAKSAHEASSAEDRHTIVVSTLVLVLGIIILVLLIN